MKKSSAYHIFISFTTETRDMNLSLSTLRRFREITKPYYDVSVQYEKDLQEIKAKGLE